MQHSVRFTSLAIVCSLKSMLYISSPYKACEDQVQSKVKVFQVDQGIFGWSSDWNINSVLVNHKVN